MLVLNSELSNNLYILFHLETHYSCRENFQSSCSEIWEQKTRELGCLNPRSLKIMRKTLLFAKSGAEGEINSPLDNPARGGPHPGKGRNRVSQENY